MSLSERLGLHERHADAIAAWCFGAGLESVAKALVTLSAELRATRLKAESIETSVVYDPSLCGENVIPFRRRQ